MPIRNFPAHPPEASHGDLNLLLHRVTDDVVWELDLATERLVWHANLESVFGYRPSDMGDGVAAWKARIHPDELDRVLRSVVAAMKSGADRWSEEYQFRRHDGEYADVIDRASLLRDETGRVVRMIGGMIDITDRKRTERELRAQRQFLDAIIENEPECVKVVSRDGRLVQMNRAGLAMLEAESVEQAQRHGLLNFVHPEDRAAFTRFHQQVCDGASDTLTFTTVGLKGTVRRLETHATPLVDDQTGDSLVLSVTRDITERVEAEEQRVRLEQQLRQAQKMESIGQLAGGVAHDFNNMLAAILGYTELALDDLTPDHPAHAKLTQVQLAAARSAELTRQLLAFARKQPITPKVLSLNDTVGGLLKMLQRIIGENIELAWKPGHHLWPVKMDPAQINQVLANLAVNARDAISGAGQLDIDTANVRLDVRACADLPGARPGEYVSLVVRDTGCGMDTATLGRLFEPFFTTKEPGRGTGLGMATVYGIVKQNDGLIYVTSAVGKGTTVTIYLPRCDEAVTAEPTAPPAPRGTETILVVEDEPAILALTQTVLERLGYSVVRAATAGDAIAAIRSRSAPVQLLLTDVVMPGLNGRDLRATVEELQPGIRTLYMSGYTADVLARNGVIAHHIHFLQKPFSRETLASAVRAALDLPGQSVRHTERRAGAS